MLLEWFVFFVIPGTGDGLVNKLSDICRLDRKITRDDEFLQC